jgi:hypothetical protein
VPTIGTRVAQERALAHIARGYDLQPTSLRGSTPQLWIYEPTLLGGPGLRRPALVWRTGVAAKGINPIREFSNMVANGGFEQDANSDYTPNGWSRNVNALRTTDASRSGGYGLRHNTSHNSSYSVEQNVKGIVARQSYTLGAAFNIPQTSDAFMFRFMIRWRNAANRPSVFRRYAPLRAAPSEHAGATSANTQMVVDSLNGTVMVDDVNLQP